VSKDLTRSLYLFVAVALLPGLVGCPVILEGEHEKRVDADGDGYLAVGYNEGDDCDDANATVNPGKTEVCGDGLDNDCSGGANNCGLNGTIAIGTSDHLIVPSAASAKLGLGVAGVGDVDGDGTEDIMVGAPGLDQSFPQSGGAFLMTGPPGSARKIATGDAALKVYGYNEDEQVGTVISAGGDMDGDGYGDILLGAPTLSASSGEKCGAWYVVLGPSGPAMSTNAAWGKEDGAADYDRLGTSVTSGDMDGDGSRDLAGGAPYANQDGGDSGHVYVHYGPVQGTESTTRADVDLYGLVGDTAGTAVQSADFDGDGIDDLMVGAPAYDGDGAAAGAAFMVAGPLGGSNLLTTANDAMLTGLSAGDGAGATLAAGDMDGDGYTDALIGALTATGVTTGSGAVLIMSGPLSGDMTADAGAMGQSEGDSVGSSLAVGDADGDGTLDLLVGAPTRNVASTDDGAAYLLYGPVDAYIALGHANVKISGADSEDYVGSAVALADWDGNGSADLILGAWGQDQDGAAHNGGLVYIFMVSGL